MNHSCRIGLKRSSSLKRARLVRPLFDRSRPDIKTVSAGCVRIIYRSVERGSLVGRIPVQTVFVVSRRVGSAVVRNRTRRIMRDTFRHVLPYLTEAAADTGAALTTAVIFRGGAGIERLQIDEDLRAALSVLIARLEKGGAPHQKLDRISGS